LAESRESGKPIKRWVRFRRLAGEGVHVGISVQISLSPSLLSVVHVQGGRVSARHESVLSPNEWDDALLKDFRPFDSALAQAMRVLHIPSGASVEVEYAGREAVVDLLSYASSGLAARDAALLSLADRIPGGSHGQPTSAWIVGADRGARTRSHVLACADRDTNVEAIASWIGRAGLRLRRVRPAAALPLVECTRAVLESEDQSPVAVIYFGGAFTCIAAGRGGSIQFVRVMNFGVDLLGEAYVRETSGIIREPGVPSEARRQAREQLWKHGIPSRGEARGAFATILPLIFPVVQKFMVEIKQTLRFGLGEAELDRVKVIATGPGASIPAFCGTLADGLEFPVDPDPRCSPSDSTSVDHAALALAFEDHRIDLSPAVEVQRRTSRRLAMSVAIGTAFGLAAVGVDAGLTYRQLLAQRQVVEANDAAVAEGREHFAQRSRAAALSGAFRDQYKALTEAMASSPDWPAVLLELAKITDTSVRLTQVDAQNNNGKPQVEITGLAFPDASGDPLRAFMTRLMKSPLAQSVELGPTRAAEVEGRHATHFTLRAVLRPLPADPGGTPRVSAVSKGEER
jgi:Tfp pilus assembly protein PilN